MFGIINRFILDERGSLTIELLIGMVMSASIAGAILSELLPQIRDLYQRMEMGVRGVSETGF